MPPVLSYEEVERSRRATGLEAAPRRLNRARQGWRRDAVAQAAMWGAVALSLGDGLLRSRVASEDDTATFYLPLSRWIAEQLQQGLFPLWTPAVFTGYPIFADGELGLANPLVVLALGLLGADNALVVLRLVFLGLAASGAYLLGREWRLTRSAAVLAGVTFALGSFFLAQIHHENIIRSAAWTPLILVGLERALRSPGRARLRWSLLSGIALTGSVMGLHVQIVLLQLLLLAGYAVGRWLSGPIRGAGRNRLARLRAVMTAALPIPLVGFAVGAVQIIPLFELSRLSFRSGGMAYEDAAAYSLTPYGFGQLVFPFLFRDGNDHQWGLWTHWESYLYVGLVPLALALVALLHVRGRAVAFWGAIGGLSILLALGQYSPLNLSYLLWMAPGLDALRAPGRATLVVTLALAMLAGFGLTWLQRSERRRTGGGAALGVATGLLIGAPLVLSGMLTVHLLLGAFPDQARAVVQAAYLSLPRDAYALTADQVVVGLGWATSPLNRRMLGAIMGLIGIAVALHVWQGGPWLWLRRWGGWPAVLIALTAADLAAFGWAVHPRVSLASLAEPSRVVAALQQIAANQPSGESPVRVLGSPVLVQVAPNRLAPLGIHDVDGYSSLEMDRHRQILERVRRVDDDLLDMLGAQYVVEPARYGATGRYGEVRYLVQNPMFEAPAGGALGEQRYAIPAGPPITEVRLVTALQGGRMVPQGATVGRITLRGADGAALAVGELRAGVETMDWSMVPFASSGAAHGRSAVPVAPGGPGASALAGSRELSYSAFSVPSVAATHLDIQASTPSGRLMVFGVAVVDASGVPRQLFGRSRSKYREVYRDQVAVVLENTAALPRAFVVPHAVRVEAPGGTLSRMTEAPFDPRQTVLLAAESPPEAASSGPPGWDGIRAGHIMSASPHAVTLTVEAPGDGYLVLADSFAPGWRAWVDGGEQTVMRGNLLFRVVRVAAGRHTVQFRYEPWSVYLGLRVSVAALVIVSGLVWWTRPLRRQS